jgi:hypothetical protein
MDTLWAILIGILVSAYNIHVRDLCNYSCMECGIDSLMLSTVWTLVH